MSRKAEGPPVRARLLLAVGVAIAAVLVVILAERMGKTRSTDFDQFWYAARALLAGRSPYAEVGPARPYPWGFPLVFPLPAVLFAVPFTALPLEAARASFAALGAGLFAFAVTRNSLRPALLCLSLPFMVAVRLGQWSPLIVTAFCLPWVAPVLAAKPNVGLSAVVAGARSGRQQGIAIVVTALMFGLSFVVYPGWWSEWVGAVASVTNYRPYVLRLGGVVLLAAGLRWRRPEARVLLVLACVPSTPAAYDALILLAALFVFEATTSRQVILIFAVLSGGSLLASGPLFRPYPSFSAYLDTLAAINLVCVYLPALILILRRPNVGAAPAWMERVASHLTARRIAVLSRTDPRRP